MSEHLPDPVAARLEDATDKIRALTTDKRNPELTWMNEMSVPLPDGSKLTVVYHNHSSPNNRVSVTLEIPSGGKIIKSWDKNYPGDKSKHHTSIPVGNFAGQGSRQEGAKRPFDDEDVLWIDTQLDYFKLGERDNGKA